MSAKTPIDVEAAQEEERVAKALDKTVSEEDVGLEEVIGFAVVVGVGLDSGNSTCGVRL